MSVNLWNRSGVYWVRVWHNGECQRWSLKTKSKSEANQKVKEIKEDIAEGLYNLQNKGPDLEEFLEEYWAFAEINKAPATVEAEKLAEKNFFGIVGRKNLDQIEKNDIELFKKKRLNKGIKPNGVNTNSSVKKKISPLPP